MSDTYDVLIIGAGPGGYVTAIRAAQLGFRTAVVDREHLGGICLNWGCIPTKALLRSAEIFHYMEHAKDYGLSAEKVGFDVGAIVKRSRAVSGRLNGGVGMLLKKNKVDVIWGEAAIEAAPKGDTPGAVVVKETTRAEAPKGAKGAGTYRAKHVIVATGARPRAIPGIEPDKDRIWTYYEAMVPKTMPKSLLVMGSGAIGIEFASFYRTMGAEVTGGRAAAADPPGRGCRDRRPRPQAVREAGHQDPHRRQGGEGREDRQGITARVETGDGKSQSIEAEVLISAVGVVGNVENLGLEGLGVTIERGIVVTDGLGRTSVPGIYAIGDVAGPPMLAHKAEHEGVACIETIKGLHTHPMDKARSRAAPTASRRSPRSA